MKNVVTIRELARLAGCSPTAASMALRNHPRISAETREKVLRLAEKHGYTRDPLVSTLMNRLRSARRTRSLEKIAILEWEKWKERNRPNPFQGQLHAGIHMRAKELGYEVEHFYANEPGMTAARLSRILYARGIRGVVLLSMARPRGHASLNWENLAAASTSYTILKPDVHRASTSHYQGMLLALRNLRHFGYERIGYVNLVGQEDMVNEAWLAAYLASDYRVHGKITVPPFLAPSWDLKKFARWIEAHRPEVVVSCWRDPLQMLGELRFSVPKDIGFALLDCPPEEEICAGIHQQRDQAGAMAVDLVVEQLETNRIGLPAHPKTVFVDSIWKNGPTLMRVRGKAAARK